MKIINTANTENTTTFSFDINQIKKLVLAENALHLLTSQEGEKMPLLLTDDYNSMMLVILSNGYINICSALLGYITAYDMSDMENGILTLEIVLPPNRNENYHRLLRQKIEYALALYLLAEVYQHEPDADKATEQYTLSMKKAMREIVASLAL